MFSFECEIGPKDTVFEQLVFQLMVILRRFLELLGGGTHLEKVGYWGWILGIV